LGAVSHENSLNLFLFCFPSILLVLQHASEHLLKKRDAKVAIRKGKGTSDSRPQKGVDSNAIQAC
jgi:hypothetical protein